MGPNKKCIICEEYTQEGVSIFEKFICVKCEKTLVNTDICDDRYDEYKELIKKNIIQSGNKECI